MSKIANEMNIELDESDISRKVSLKDDSSRSSVTHSGGTIHSASSTDSIDDD